MIGTTISHYKILEKLGEGGMGVVYKAQDTKLDRLVALKFLPHHLTGSSEAVKRFQLEAKAASALNHPNILTIYDFEEAEGESFIAMELVEGISLKARITDTKSRGVSLSLDEILAWTIEIAEGLSKAHEKGIVHRDIKSDNIMITQDGHAKIMDFGLAKLRGSSMLTKTGTTVGTLAYMAPEQLQGIEADQRADIYAFGVVLFEITTGQLPFQGAHEAALMYEILNTDPRTPSSLRPDVPPALEHIVLKCMEKKKESRYSSMKDMLADIKAVMVSSLPTGMNTHSRRLLPFPSLNTRAIAVVAGIILAVIVLAKLFLFNPANQAIDSVAVMPFKNVSANAEVDYLSDGITENLINSLSRISSLRVVPRSTAFSYKDRKMEAQQIGKELDVRAVVTGRVVQRGDNLNVQTELIDIHRQAQIWGEQYNQKMSDILGLQEQLAKQISEKLRPHLTGEEKTQLTKRYTENTEAYQLYLKGNYYVKKATPEDLEKGLSLLYQALKIDPNFALPYVGIAYYYAIQTDFSMAPNPAMPELKKATAKALSLDGELADAKAFDAMYDLWYTWNWPAAEKGLRMAIQLGPNDYTPHFFYSWYLLSQGDSLKAVEEARRFLELEPLSAEENALYGHVLYYAHRYDEAFNHLQRTLDLSKDHPFTHLILSWCYLRNQRVPEAIASAQKLYEIFPVPWCRARLAYVYARAGERSKAAALLDTLRQESKHVYVASDIVASVYTALGDKDRAFEYLDKGFQERAGWMVFMKVDPIWDPLRSDPRFSALLKKMGLEK